MDINDIMYQNIEYTVTIIVFIDYISYKFD